ncbi:hypothetical protein [Phocaeicola vulgatus]|uniref:hypothetical protein n=1 Tax=Phocaeicola vulgatus TaxID=821 RepID=UPI00321B5882
MNGAMMFNPGTAPVNRESRGEIAVTSAKLSLLDCGEAAGSGDGGGSGWGGGTEAAEGGGTGPGDGGGTGVGAGVGGGTGAVLNRCKRHALRGLTRLRRMP